MTEKWRGPVPGETFDSESPIPVVVGLDIGSTKTVAIAGRLNGSGMLEILGFGRSENHGMRNGIIFNIQDVAASIKQSMHECLTSGPLMRVDEVYAGIAGIHTRVLSTRCEGIREAPDQVIHREEVNRLIADQYRNDVPGIGQIIEIIPKGFSVDGLSEIPDPTGCFGARIGSDFHVVTADGESMARMRMCAELAGVEAIDFIFKPLASASAVLCQQGLEAGVAIIDIGGDTTSLSVFRDGMLKHLAVLPFGGDNITHDIKRGLGILRQHAERLKVCYGNAMPDTCIDDAYVSIPGLRGLPNREVGVGALSRIIHARMVDILEIVNYSLRSSGIDAKMLHGGVILTGGGARLDGLVELTEFVTGMQARIGRTEALFGNADPGELAKPEYSTCLGLVHRGSMLLGQKMDPIRLAGSKSEIPTISKRHTNEPLKYTGKAIRAVALGGAAINAMNLLLGQSIDEVDFIACDTDYSALDSSKASTKIRLGANITHGFGSGANPDVGRLSMRESVEDFQGKLMGGTKLLLLVAALGGGTGSGSAAMAVRIARQMGILSVAVVTLPFSYEGRRRADRARKCLGELLKSANAVLVIRNDDITSHQGGLTMRECFSKADEALASSARSIIDVVWSRGRVNIDYSDIYSLLVNGGGMKMGNAVAEGRDRAIYALGLAIDSRMLEGVCTSGVAWLMVDIKSPQGAHECRMEEVETIHSHIQRVVGPDTEVFLALSHDNSLGRSISITLVAPTDRRLSSGLDAVEGRLPLEIVVESDASPPTLAHAAGHATDGDTSVLDHSTHDGVVDRETGPPRKPSSVDPHGQNTETSTWHETTREPIYEGSRSSSEITRSSVAPYSIPSVPSSEELERSCILRDTADQESWVIGREHSRIERASFQYEGSSNPDSTKPRLSDDKGQLEKPEVKSDLLTVLGKTPAEELQGSAGDLDLGVSAQGNQVQDGMDRRQKKSYDAWRCMRNHMFNVSLADLHIGSEIVPTCLRRHSGEGCASETSKEGLYSSISVMLDEKGDKSSLSTLNSFLDGYKPD